jgi:hypothetical protein
MRPVLNLKSLCQFAATVGALAGQARAADPDATSVIDRVITTSCLACHDADSAEGGLNLASLRFDVSDRSLRQRWVRIHDRVMNGEMPPAGSDLSELNRTRLLSELSKRIHAADYADVVTSGRGPMRRLNRDEYQQNLRDVLQRPRLDIRDMLPEDREGHHFNKTSETLDISRVQLMAYLNAAEVALLRAMASDVKPPSVVKYRAVGRRLFSSTSTFGNRQAMFFARHGKAIADKDLNESPDDPEIELALFRSAHWPYYGYPQGFRAALSGEYHVRFSARAVLQMRGFELTPATKSIVMTFRSRQPSGPDVSGDVRATGGLFDIQPERAVFETTITLRAGETFEYSLLGLPVPLARNVNGGPPTYRYPPFPEAGQPGVAFQWLEVEGPLSPDQWPPPSHRVLFDDLPMTASPAESALPVEVTSDKPADDVRRLLRQFIDRAAREPVSDEVIQRFEQLALRRLDQGGTFAEAMLAACKAFLSSGHMLYLHEPRASDASDHYSIASRLSHFLTNSRPDPTLLDCAARGELRDPHVLQQQTERMIESVGFDRFVENFTNYWLNLRHIHRDEPDIRLYPEYRFDAYLVESMERETRAFFTAMVRENLPARSLITGNFAFINDRLAEHYKLEPVTGSAIRRVQLPDDSPYGGLLTQAAILKVTANGTTTSPVVRGAWVMERLIGLPAPPPPASVPAVEPDIRGATTIRELLALHTKSDSCAACHARFDPVGVALENFDIFGSWRTQYRGLEGASVVTGIDRAGHDFSYAQTANVDPVGKLIDGREFTGVVQLKRLLTEDTRQLARNLIHQFTVYATGTPVRFSDRVEVEAILDACKANDYRVRDLLIALVQSRLFVGTSQVASPSR